jgi:septal ring factor EnvC (AmiA/AmiB activator)
MYDKILFILSADNFAQSYRRLRYLKEYAAWQKLQAGEIIDKQKDLVLKKGQLAQSRRDKMTLLKDRENETLKLKHEEDSQKIEISNLKKQEKTLQTELDQKKKQAQELNRQIEKAIAEEIAKAEKDAQKDAASNKKETRVAETKGGYAMTKAEKELSSNFADNKGKLPYPLKGKYQIIGHFGQQQHQDLKYVKTNNNGIDIQTASSTDALSVFDGEVTRIFVVAGYNNSVIVRHGNYLTVYSNLSEVYIKAGTKVKTGQSIGKIFTDTEDNNSTILHFEIWKERDKLNPEVWLN